MDISLIPKGNYCYTITSIDSLTNEQYRAVCPYWQYKEQHGIMGIYCAYLKIGTVNRNFNFLLWDQIKECKVNEE